MNCRQAEKWIDAVLDESPDAALSQDWRVQLEAHLRACAPCRRQWELLRAADAALRAPRPAAAPTDLLQEFRLRLAAEGNGAGSRGAGRGWLRRLRAAGASRALGPPRSQGSQPAPAPRAGAEAMPGAPRLSHPKGARWRAGDPWIPMSLGTLAAAGAIAALVISLRLQSPGPGPEGKTMARAPRATRVSPEQQFPVESPAARSAGNAREPAAEAKAAAPQHKAGFTNKRRGELETSASSASTASAPGRSAMKEQARPAAPALRHFSHGERLTDRPDAATRGDTARHAGRKLARAAAPAQVSEAAQVPAVELSISPALLTALQRPVEVRTGRLSLQAAAEQLGQKADVPVEVDPGVPPISVTLEQGEVPLWQALESVARQGSLEIYPRENHLLLRLAGRGAQKAESFRRRQEAAPGSGAAGPRAKESPGREAAARQKLEQGRATEEPPAGAAARGGMLRDEAPGQLPDRGVWPPEWGSLPERGFAVLDAEELLLAGPDTPAAENRTRPAAKGPVRARAAKSRSRGGIARKAKRRAP